MTIESINNHVELALNRLLTQYKEKPRFAALITALVEQIQQLEDATFGLIDGRALATATGQQLDNLGTIVNQARLGFDDDFYRILITVKIGQNTSQGQAPKIIDIFKLLTQATFVHYMNHEYAGIGLATTSAIAEDQVSFIYKNMEQVLAAGVRVDHIVSFDENDSFAFAGVNTLVVGKGFSDLAETAGGKLPVLYRDKTRFAFSGRSESFEGFGSLDDPLVGGTLAGIGGT